MQRVFDYLKEHKVQMLLIAILIVVFWHPILFNNEFFYDDWAFINKVQGADFSYRAVLIPDNGHFAPIFKSLFFTMLKVFGPNIVPFMCFSILMQIIICGLLFYLLLLIFPMRRFLPFLLLLFFSLSSAYFEILHWFAALGQSFSLLALLLTLIFMHKGIKENNKNFIASSVVASFFIPMHYSMGLLGIIFIFLYYFCVLRPNWAKGSLVDGLKTLYLYLLTWLLYLAVYLPFAIPGFLHQPETAPAMTINIGNVMLYALLGFVGILVKNFGYTLLVFPYTTALAVFMTLFFVVFSLVLILYFLLNPKRDRIPVFDNSKIALFSLVSMLLCYVLLAVSRASLGVEAFLSWGRYHYYPMVFFTILMGVVLPQIVKIFSLIFKESRFKTFLLILFVIFLLTQFILIRQKSESPVRMEGSVPISAVCS